MMIKVMRVCNKQKEEIRPGDILYYAPCFDGMGDFETSRSCVVTKDATYLCALTTKELDEMLI